MSEQRFTIQKASGMYLHLPIFDNGVEMADGDVCILLNEQQDTINKLQEELELTAKNKLFSRRKLEEENKQLKKENEKLGNIHLSIDLTYSCGYGRYLADVRVIDDE